MAEKTGIEVKLDYMESEIQELKADVKEIKERPAKNAVNIKQTIVTCVINAITIMVVGAIIAAIIAYI